MHISRRPKLHFSLILTAVLCVLMTPTPAQASTPIQLATGEHQFAVRNRWVCAINETHRLYCWGDNTGNQLGIGKKRKFVQSPQQVGTDRWRSVYAISPYWSSVDGMCAIKWNRSVWCWSNGNSPSLITSRKSLSVEQVGLGWCIRDLQLRLWCNLYNDEWFGRDNPAMTGWTQITKVPVLNAVGRARTNELCFVQLDRTMKCLGKNLNATFPTGKGTPRFIRTPRAVSGSFLALLDSAEHSCALDVEGFQRCWGTKESGGGYTLPDRIPDSWVEQNGDPCVVWPSRPSFCVSTPARIEDIRWSTLWTDRCGIQMDGTLDCVHDVSSLLGTYSVTIEGDFVEVRLADIIGCAKNENSSLWCWGLNDFQTDSVSGYRQYGLDATDYARTPQQILVGP